MYRIATENQRGAAFSHRLQQMSQPRGGNPTIRRVLARIPEPQRLSPGLVGKAANAAKRELSFGS